MREYKEENHEKKIELISMCIYSMSTAQLMINMFLSQQILNTVVIYILYKGILSVQWTGCLPHATDQLNAVWILIHMSDSKAHDFNN